MRHDLVRSLVEAALDRIVAGERADRVLAAILRKNRNLGSDERARVAAWTLGLSLWRGRMDALAGGDRSLWLALFLVDRERRGIDEAAALADVPCARVREALAHPPEPRDPVERLAFTRSLPRWLARRWIAQLGAARADALAAAVNEPGPVTVRANTLRTTRDALRAKLASEGVPSRPTTLARDGLVLEGRPNVVALEAWREGLFEVQDEGSQLVAEAVQAQPGELVVDLCAGSGGKALALAADLRDRGRVVAIDVDPQRLVDLRVRARRDGVGCIESRAGDGRDPSTWAGLEGRADRVLVDAPCSALGTLRRGPDARWRVREEDVARFAQLQRELLTATATLVRPGGRLVYATCSVDPEENEAVAATLGAPAFALIDAMHLWPDTHGTDGFFWAAWLRTDGA